MATSAQPIGEVLARRRGPRWLRHLLTVLAGVYLASLFLESAAQRLPRAYLPASLLYFTQATCLFPRAARMAIDYRLEGWDCAALRFREIDVSALFPIRPWDKESRFQRIAHFYRQNRSVMHALEHYVLGRQSAGAQPHIGGVRLSSVRTPLPPLGASVGPWQPAPLDESSADRIKNWYYTPESRRRAFCAGSRPAPERPNGEAPRSSAPPSELHDDDTQELPEDLP